MEMANLMRYDPLREVLSLREAANRFFAQSFVRPAWLITDTALAPMDLIENEQGYQVKVKLPGVKPEAIELTVRQNTLTLKGQHSSTKEEKKENWVVKEIRSGSFGRSITFDKPIDADKIDTSYENGVPTISVPYSEAGKPKKISIKKEEPKELAEAGAR
jgi:HSP20 family protein